MTPLKEEYFLHYPVKVAKMLKTTSVELNIG